MPARIAKRKKNEAIAQSTTSGLSSSSKITRVNRARVEILNEDVLHLIFEHFDLKPGSKDLTRKHLLSAAKTCKAFLEPALNSLWRTLPSLLPLLLLLPSAQVSDDTYFIDNLSIDNWERFEIHARRVRALFMENSYVFIPPTVYLGICGLRDSFVLPGLKQIYIPDRSTSIDLPSIMHLASGAPLDFVWLNSRTISNRSFYMQFMTLLASKSPQLTHLVLRGRSMSLEPVYRFMNLQRLELWFRDTDYDLKIITKLGNLVNLSDLTINVDSPIPLPAIDTPPPIILSSSSHGSFRKLRMLHISGVLSSIDHILNDINLASVVTLVMDETLDTGIFGATTSRAGIIWRHIFNHLSVSHAIEDIEINQHNHSRYWYQEGDCMSASWLLPLSTLRNVKSLVINGSAFSGSDNDFRSLACAFPKLRKLVVSSAYLSYYRGTLACLFHFSQECPDLREIRIPLTSDTHSNHLDAIKKLPPHTIPVNYQHPLQKLCIQSQFDEMERTFMVQIAEFLNLIFPNMAILEAGSSNDPDLIETSNWAEIQRIHLDLQAARSEKRHPIRIWQAWNKLTVRLAKFPYCPDT